MNSEWGDNSSQDNSSQDNSSQDNSAHDNSVQRRFGTLTKWDLPRTFDLMCDLLFI